MPRFPTTDLDFFICNRAINSGIRWWQNSSGKKWSDPLSPDEALELLTICDSHCPFSDDDPRINKWHGTVERLANALTIFDLEEIE